MKPHEGLYLLVGTANLPSKPAPAKKWDMEDYAGTNKKEGIVLNRFLSKNNVYRCWHLKEKIETEEDYDRHGWHKFVRLNILSTTSTTPLLISNKKTGPGTYFLFGNQLFLADSAGDVSNHVNQEDTQSNSNNSGRERIPDDTQIFVWNRDDGACVKCGSRESLAFDHIIPHSLGGSNSRRNLQLLCDSCNLKKSNKIGG